MQKAYAHVCMYCKRPDPVSELVNFISCLLGARDF